MDQVTSVGKRGAEFWKAHVLRAQEFLGSNMEYCRVNGLTNSTFATYKKRLGFVKSAKPRRKLSAFSKIEELAPLSLDLAKASLRVPQPRSLPNPKWVAELILALHSS